MAEHVSEDEHARTEEEMEEGAHFRPRRAGAVPDDHEEVTALPPDVVIIPKIVVRKIEDSAIETILEEVQEDEEDRHQHFFSDQVKFERPKWAKPWFNAMAMVAWALDMSNVTSFPATVATNGGLAFLLAYFVVLGLFVYPVMYMEAVLGQYFQTGMIGIWGLIPVGRGLGISLFYLSFMITSVLPANTLWAIMMLYNAVIHLRSGTLDWIGCDNDWNTCLCEFTRVPDCLEQIRKAEEANITVTRYSPAEEYFLGVVLRMWKSKHIDPHIISEIEQNGNWNISYGFNNAEEGLGPLIPSSCAILFFIYFLMVYFEAVGLKVQGYFFTFTCCFTLLVLALLLFRTMTLQGAFSGMRTYMRMDWGKLLGINTWHAALERAFYSLGSGTGIHFMLASFSTLEHNVRRDIIICIVIDTLVSVLATLVGFMFVGHFYDVLHYPLPDPFPRDNMVFITIAECFGSISGSSFFATIFFLMIVLFTLDTVVVVLWALSFSLYEEFKRKYPDIEVSRFLFLYSVWGFSFSICLLCTLRGGYWVFIFVLQYNFGLIPFIIMFLETVIFAWFWGIEEMCNASEFILGYRPGLFLRLCWKFILPVTLGLFVSTDNDYFKFQPMKIFEQEAPNRTQYLGFTLTMLSLGIIFLYLIYVFIKLRTVTPSCLKIMLMSISPEYEHDEIMNDPRSSKRLKWDHYTFLQFDDEVHWKLMLKDAVKCVIKFFAKLKCRKRAAPVAPEEPAETPVKKKKERKKKKKDGALEEGEESAWDLFDKLKHETSGDEIPLVEKASSTGKKKKKRQSIGTRSTSSRDSSVGKSKGQSGSSSSKKKKGGVKSKKTLKQV